MDRLAFDCECRSLGNGRHRQRRRAVAALFGIWIDIKLLRLEDRLDFIIAVDVGEGERRRRNACYLDAVRDPPLENAVGDGSGRNGCTATGDDNLHFRIHLAAHGIAHGVDGEPFHSRTLVGANIVLGVLGIDAGRADAQPQVAGRWIDKERIRFEVACAYRRHRRNCAAVGGGDGVVGIVVVWAEVRLDTLRVAVAYHYRVFDIAFIADHAKVIGIGSGGRECISGNRAVL